MKISDAQFSALSTLREFGPIRAVEVQGPPGMDGKRRVRLECRVMNNATLAKLQSEGLVDVSRKPLPRVKNAVGNVGHPRIALTITATEAGLAALNT